VVLTYIINFSYNIFVACHSLIERSYGYGERRSDKCCASNGRMDAALRYFPPCEYLQRTKNLRIHEDDIEILNGLQLPRSFVDNK
jgi:hypothetical protein